MAEGSGVWGLLDKAAGYHEQFLWHLLVGKGPEGLFVTCVGFSVVSVDTNKVPWGAALVFKDCSIRLVFLSRLSGNQLTPPPHDSLLMLLLLCH